MNDLHPTHRWGETFAEGLGPLVCLDCLCRDDSHRASQPCDRLVAVKTSGRVPHHPTTPD